MTQERVASVDVANHELFAALREPGCPMCRVLANSDRRAVASLVHEGYQNPGIRHAFIEAAGLCVRHATALLEESERVGTGAVIADLYGKVADRDLMALSPEPTASRPRRRRELVLSLPRRGRCYLCGNLASAEHRHAHFLLTLLQDEAAKAIYRDSDGLCRRHVALALGRARSKRKTAALGDWLLEEWRDRLARLRQLVADYDRKRDYHFAGRRTDDEQASWRRIIDVYVGDAGFCR